MIAAIIRAQLLSLRPARRGGYAARIFGWFTTGVFLAMFALVGFGAAVLFSQADMQPYFIPILCGGMMFVMAYWQLAPVITASFGASLDLRKMLAYPIPHRTLFLVEVILRVTTSSEMLVLMCGAATGLLRNPLYGWPAVPGIVGGALVFCVTNILLSAGTRNLLERLFMRSRMREIVIFIFVMTMMAPRLIIAYGGIGRNTLSRAVPTQFFWPWSAPAHVMLGDELLPSLAATALWFGVAWAFRPLAVRARNTV